MKLFLFLLMTGIFIAVSGLAIFLTNKAGENGHNDNEGRFYYAAMLLSGIVYTVNNVIYVVG